MDKRIALLLKVCRKKSLIFLIAFITAFLIFLLIWSNSSMNTSFGKLIESSKNQIDTEIFLEYASYYLLYFLFEFLIDACSDLCAFLTENYISHWFFDQKININFFDFKKITPEEHFNDFKIKTEAFTHMFVLIVFRLPINSIMIITTIYKIIVIQKDKIIRNSILSISVGFIYTFISILATSSRKKLRNEFNNSKIAKNSFSRTAFDNYEICVADQQQEKQIDQFENKLLLHSKSYLNFSIISEHFRLITRSLITFLKLLFVFIRLNDDSITIAGIISTIDQLNRFLLQLRNDAFMFFEYWNECNFDQIKELALPNKIVSSPFNIKIISDILNPNIIKIKDKSKILISGESGSGKTSLLNSIVGISNTNYAVSINDININSINKFNLYSNISFMSQKQHIFNKNIEFNLLYGTTLNSKTLVEKLKFLNFLSYFDQFENRLKTVVGEKSYGLSNGQKQIICFLRCILKNANVYIIDDPLSFLDTQMVTKVCDVIRNLSNKTVIVSSKSISCIDLFDQVIVLKKL